MNLNEIILIASVVGFCMYAQLVMNTGNAVRVLKRIEERLAETEASSPD